MSGNILKSALDIYPDYDALLVDKNLEDMLSKLNKKIVVLDDDPTGVQTVNGVHVYTDWTVDSIEKGFDEDNSIFFILTNSRGCTYEETIRIHREIAENIGKVSKKKNQEFILISRGDSTLRGHYPIETEVLRDVTEESCNQRIDGEIIIPFFAEGGRLTVDGVHYVTYDDTLVPVGETEFAKDRTFGYKSSHLAKWIEEKSAYAYSKESVTQIRIDRLRTLDYEGIKGMLMKVEGFNKVIVDAIEYEDIKVFVTAMVAAMQEGKSFIIRSAAGLIKIIGGIKDRPLLGKKELINTKNNNGGLIIVGSHVKKTTKQLEVLMALNKEIYFIEFDAHLVKIEDGLDQEVQRIIRLVEEKIQNGITSVVYTSRKLIDLETTDKQKILEASVKISNAVTSIVDQLTVRPNFIIAKGGITSSDVGTKGLHVKKALVIGQILKGIPVWLTGQESKFPNMPYVIFPGNVGSDSALSDAVKIMNPNNENTM